MVLRALFGIEETKEQIYQGFIQQQIDFTLHF